MMTKYTLAVDGSTYAGTVALIRGREVIAERSLPDSGIPERGQRGEDFMPMVVACMSDAGVSAADLERVICGAGPGSFTSLRIAASIAKGMAVGAGRPLYAVSSLLLIPAASDLSPGKYFVALPAMRGESYVIGVDVSSESIRSDGPVQIVPTLDVERIAVEMHRVVIGPGFGKGLKPHARGVARIVEQVVAAGQCDLNTWEPAYGRLAEAQVKWEAAHGRPLVQEA